MDSLLSDSNTYEAISESGYQDKIANVNKSVRDILSRSSRGKGLMHLLPKIYSPAYIYGLPKLHKPNVPLRPIVSGVGSLLHQLAGRLAKAISHKVGTISNSTLKHSGDMINRVKSISIRNKQLASYDVTSLFTNVPTKKAVEVLRNILSDDDDLPVPLNDFIDLINICFQLYF